MGNYETIISENCKVFTDIIDTNSLGIINALINSAIGKDAKIRIMPDVHAATGFVYHMIDDLEDYYNGEIDGNAIQQRADEKYSALRQSKKKKNMQKLEKGLERKVLMEYNINFYEIGGSASWIKNLKHYLIKNWYE